MCEDQFANQPALLSWWWDIKNITSYDNMTADLCLYVKEHIIDQQEYGNVKNVGTRLVIDG